MESNSGTPLDDDEEYKLADEHVQKSVTKEEVFARSKSKLERLLA